MPERVDSERLGDELTRLNDELRCIRDVLDEVRENLVWSLHNGRVILSLADVQQLTHVADANIGPDIIELTVRLHTALAVLREDFLRAVDGQRQSQFVATEVERSEPAPIPAENRTPTKSDEPPFQLVSESASLPRQRSVQRKLFDVTDPELATGRTIEFSIGEHNYSGEILQIDRDGGTAEVCLAPSMETVTISLEALGIDPNQDCDAALLDPGRLPEIILFEVSDAVKFLHQGKEVHAEVESLDDARNRATVLLTPSMQRMTVSQDELTKIETPVKMPSAKVKENSPQEKEPAKAIAAPNSSQKAMPANRAAQPKTPTTRRRRQSG